MPHSWLAYQDVLTYNDELLDLCGTYEMEVLAKVFGDSQFVQYDGMLFSSH